MNSILIISDRNFLEIGYYELRFGGNETMRYYIGLDIFEPKLGYVRSEKPETNVDPHLGINTTGSQLRNVGSQVKVNGSKTIFKHQWESNKRFNNCMQYTFARRHCEIMNGTRLQGCGMKRNDINCTSLNTDFPLYDSLLCNLNWMPKIRAFSLKIEMNKTFNLTWLGENLRYLNRSSINIHGVLSCEASSKKMKQKYVAKINFEYNSNIKQLLSDEVLQFIENISAGTTISSNTVPASFFSSEINTALTTITCIGMIFVFVLVILCMYKILKRDFIFRY
jgi:hypothetical protein